MMVEKRSLESKKTGKEYVRVVMVQWKLEGIEDAEVEDDEAFRLVGAEVLGLVQPAVPLVVAIAFAGLLQLPRQEAERKSL